MTCHYLEEDRYRKICKAKGILSPTFTELRLYCYKSAYICPVYQAYIGKAAHLKAQDEDQIKQRHLDAQQDERTHDYR